MAEAGRQWLKKTVRDIIQDLADIEATLERIG